MDSASLQAAIGNFRFDSDRSRLQGDARLFVRPEAWPQVEAFFIQELNRSDGALESDPRRELAEEFFDALGVDLQPEQYRIQQESLVLEPGPVPTTNLAAAGTPTVRLYSVFSGYLVSPSIVEAVLSSSVSLKDSDLYRMAIEDRARGGQGRANALLALPLNELVRFCAALPADQHDQQISFAGHKLQSSVLALLPEVGTRRYTRLPSTGCW
jgi:hypothetical protein